MMRVCGGRKRECHELPSPRVIDVPCSTLPVLAAQGQIKAYLLLELCPVGCLNYVIGHQADPGFAAKARLSRGILAGMNFLHQELLMVHRDVKCEWTH